jgi:hypothetical protein
MVNDRSWIHSKNTSHILFMDKSDDHSSRVDLSERRRSNGGAQEAERYYLAGLLLAKAPVLP